MPVQSSHVFVFAGLGTLFLLMGTGALLNKKWLVISGLVGGAALVVVGFLIGI